ncbi:hypothetical protein OAM18_05270 [Candidatus Pelagibacter sp.]|jgi:hypothetical protein|nr:hypothetical protein [Candidatus Pelagibacter sp.]
MFLNKIIIGLFLISFLNGCVQSTSFLGPVYTYGATGNTLQAGLTYGSNKMVTSLTGKTAGQNVKKILKPKTSDSEFQKMVKKRIIETRKKLNLAK